MDLLLISDNKALNRELEPLLREAAGSSPRVLSGKELLEGGDVPGADVVLVEKRTWQNGFSMFRYFGLTSALDRMALVGVSRVRRAGALKGRVGRKDFSLSLPATADAVRRVLDDARMATEQLRGE